MREFFPDGPIWYVAFLFSLTCHEASHALAAKLLGDETAYDAGQVTLNPMPHIRREPFGTVVVPLISFVLGGWMIGWASAPYDPHWQQRYPKRAALMALAGPVANFLIVLLAAGGMLYGISQGIFDFSRFGGFTSIVVSAETGAPSGLSVFCSILFSLNLLLGTFNLLPLPPLDGATVIGLLFDEETALRIYAASRNPSFQLLGMFIAWHVFGRIFAPVFVTALTWLYSFAS
ncbi:MAG: site-2 protease family protein [Bdellovibrionota bacterium]